MSKKHNNKIIMFKIMANKTNNINKLIINYIVNNLWHKTKVLCNYKCNFKLFNNKCNYNNNLLHNKFNFILNKCINKFMIK